MRAGKYKKLSGAVAAVALTTGLSVVATAAPAGAADADIAVTEVNPRASDTSLGKDWLELTNTGSTAINLTGWRIDDDSNSFGSGGVITGITSIAAGESIILIPEGSAASVATFRTQWWGGSPPAGLQVGYLTGSGLGLGSGGDAVNVFNSAGTRVAYVTFGSTAGSAPFKTLDNTAAIDGAVTLRSEIGTNAAFQSVEATEIGSPGLRSTGPAPVVPEFPVTALAGVTGGALIGGWFVLRRRRDVAPTIAG